MRIMCQTILKSRRPFGPQIPAEGPSGLMTSSFVPFGHSGIPKEASRIVIITIIAIINIIITILVIIIKMTSRKKAGCRDTGGKL